MTAHLTQLTMLHINQSPGITQAAFMVLMQSPRLHMVFLVEVDGYRLLVNTGVSKSIRKLFLLDCNHIAPVLGHCPHLLTLEVHERPILHNHRGGRMVHLPGGLCSLPDIGLLLPRSLQHLTLKMHKAGQRMSICTGMKIPRCAARGGVALPSLKHLVLGSEQLHEDEDSVISEAGVEVLCRLFSSDSIKTLRLYSRFPLSAIMIACMGACWPFLEDVGLTVAPLRPSGRSPELCLALYMDNHGDHPFVLARADAGEPLGELDAQLRDTWCWAKRYDALPVSRTQQRYTGGESVGGRPARKVAHLFGLSDPVVQANPGWVMSPVARECGSGRGGVAACGGGIQGGVSCVWHEKSEAGVAVR
ncbi:hypothetical protein K439DRAFT_1624292 [Ramaria rubella]|nr:hypothetical protein K439DRAFT_1624292 [Ramaria rubella]